MQFGIKFNRAIIKTSIFHSIKIDSIRILLSFLATT